MPTPPTSLRTALRVLIAATAVAVVAAVAAPAGAATKPMTIERSRTVYLGAVCAFNTLQAERGVALEAAKAAGAPTGVGSPMPADLRKTAPEFARLARQAYRTFADPPASWPDALQPNIAIATAYAAVMAQRAAQFDASTIPAVPPTWDTMIAAQRVNLPLLRGALGFTEGTDPCAGRSASEFTIQTVPVESAIYWIAGGPS